MNEELENMLNGNLLELAHNNDDIFNMFEFGAFNYWLQDPTYTDRDEKFRFTIHRRLQDEMFRVLLVIPHRRMCNGD